jgi:hypothetical protein
MIESSCHDDVLKLSIMIKLESKVQTLLQAGTWNVIAKRGSKNNSRICRRRKQRMGRSLHLPLNIYNPNNREENK